MMLLQLSAGTGPQECCKAVALAFEKLKRESTQLEVAINIVEQQPSKHGFKSLLLKLSGDNAKDLCFNWQGAMVWQCQSPYRAKHKRKNWFFSGQVYEVNQSELDSEIRYQACRASGAGGQHVNTTDSAVRAVHVETGLSVRVESQRSQHANKRLACALIFKKLEEQKLQNMSQQEKQRWQQHWQLERGNPKKIFKGGDFKLV